MPISLFSERNINPKNVDSLEITDHEAKRKIIENWQKGLISGKILSQNEKKLQSEFLNKIFGEVLGYSYEKHLNTWQLENELKVNLDGRTPDGALGYFSFENGKINQQVFAVIELKGPLTNLDKKQNRADFKGTPVEQAFSYIPKLDKPCPWVIVSNCQEIRLYRYALGMGQYESFNILELLQNGNFKRFCYLLQQGQLFLNVTDSPIERLFLEREKELKNITNEFYDRYKDLREKLFAQVRKNNPEIPAVDLLRCTQKLIDRLLFMCFVRDLDIVQNMIAAINKAVDESFDQEEDALWKQLRFAFTALDKGYRKKNIPPFNGGLFRQDKLLENLIVKDFRLGEFMDFLNQYDYQNQLNINVLGHIFEQSISDIEEIKSRLQDEEPIFEGINENTSKAVNTKRKADGVFYTPEYITRYMVEQALGAYLDEAEDHILATLNITELPILSVQDYETVGFDDFGKCTNNNNINLHLNYWEKYDDVLRKIKVIDPACGSGAFLTQVFDYLYLRWTVLKTEVNRLITPYKKQMRDLEALQKYGNNGFAEMPFDEWNIKKNIIQNNLFGVDLNPESVEITKLSLWMKTANKKEKLADMDGNIKQGNSLIDDPEFSEAAFDWQTHFSEVFADGGFDIVVGNPPYVSANNMTFDERDYFNNHSQFQTLKGKWDLYIPFVERGLKILKDGGILTYIIPYGLLNQPFGSEIRKLILTNYSLKSIVDLHEIKIFEQATVPCCIPFIMNSKPDNQDIKIIHREGDLFVDKYKVPFANYLKSDLFMFRTENLRVTSQVLDKIKMAGVFLEELFYVSTGAEIHGKESRSEEGALTSGQSKFDVLSEKYQEGWKPYIEGNSIPKSKELGNYSYPDIDYYLDYSKKIFMRSPKFPELFNSEKIILRGSSGLLYILATYDNRKLYTSHKTLIIISKSNLPNNHTEFDLENKQSLKYLLTILNSKLMDFYYGSVFGGFIDIYPSYLKALPIPKIEIEKQKVFEEKANLMLSLKKDFKESLRNYLGIVKIELKCAKVEKLENWFRMSFEGFVSEVKKQKGGFKDLAQQMEWQGFFKENQAKALALQEQIDKTNAEIDEMVFNLYGLSAEEIAIVRG